ncbi:MAG: DUF1244 domain-containing protein [Rhizobiales bacterium]|nr:DUF1244 domain-containing protein [Hyphomicrobiales bacterium]
MTTSDDDALRTQLEAAAFRRLLAHLSERSDVQNIDLMNLAGFCRNCLANWYREAAEAEGQAMSKDEARERVYGMPYEVWRQLHQKEASAEAVAAFAAAQPRHD